MKIKIIVLSLLSFIAFAQTKDTVTATGVIEKYLNAIGGKINLVNVKDRTTEMTGLIQEMTVKVNIYQKKPNLFKQVMKLQDLEKIVIYNGFKGIIKTNEEHEPLTGTELEKLKLDADMNFMLNDDTSVVKFTFAGKDTVGNKDAYKIIVNTKSGNWTQYYDIESGLRVKDEKPMDTPQGKFVQTSWYYNYKDVNGLKYPFRIVQQMGKQRIEFEVESIKLNQGISDSVFTVDQ